MDILSWMYSTTKRNGPAIFELSRKFKVDCINEVMRTDSEEIICEHDWMKLMNDGNCVNHVKLKVYLQVLRVRIQEGMKCIMVANEGKDASLNTLVCSKYTF